MPVVRTGLRSSDYKSLAKFLGCIDNQIFLPMVLRFTRLTALLSELAKQQIYTYITLFRSNGQDANSRHLLAPAL